MTLCNIAKCVLPYHMELTALWPATVWGSKASMVAMTGESTIGVLSGVINPGVMNASLLHMQCPSDGFTVSTYNCREREGERRGGGKREHSM
jgi:hypothetical protein